MSKKGSAARKGPGFPAGNKLAKLGAGPRTKQRRPAAIPKIGCVQHDCDSCKARAKRLKALRVEVEKSCPRCDFDEADGGLINHCFICCQRITRAAFGYVIGVGDGQK